MTAFIIALGVVLLLFIGFVLAVKGEKNASTQYFKQFKFAHRGLHKDPDVPENNLDVMLKARMGKQQLSQWQTGWLVLDDEKTVTASTTVVGIG